MNGALLLAVASVLTGILNYASQVHAATVLDAGAFGAFSTWFSRVTLFGAVSTVLQFASLEIAVPLPRVHGALRLSSVASAAVVIALVASPSRFGPTALGVVTVVGSLVFYAWVGQFQRRLWLGAVGAAVLAMAAFRFGLPFMVDASSRGPWFFVAQASAALVGTTVLTLATMAGPRTEMAPRVHPRLAVGSRVLRPLILAGALVAFPVLDVLGISSVRSAEEVGAFARVALGSRIVLFGGAAVLQALYPHEVREAEAPGTAPRMVLLVLRRLPLLTLVGAPLFALLIDHGLLHLEGSERRWLYASCISAGLLVAILGKVQVFGAELRMGWMGASVGGVIVARAIALTVAHVAGGAFLDRYVSLAVVGDVCVLGIAQWSDVRARRGPTLG